MARPRDGEGDGVRRRTGAEYRVWESRALGARTRERGLGVIGTLAVVVLLALLLTALLHWKPFGEWRPTTWGGGSSSAAAGESGTHGAGAPSAGDRTGRRSAGRRGDRRAPGVVIRSATADDPGPVRVGGDGVDNSGGAITPVAGRQRDFGSAALHRSRQERAEEEMRRLVGAIETFRNAVGRNPARLVELSRPLPGYLDGLLGPAGVPTDPWGHDYQYDLLDGEGGLGPVTLRSFGSDLERGGEGDAADLAVTLAD